MEDQLATATSLQQNFYELSDDWHCYEAGEHNYLKESISFALFGASLNQPAEDASQNDENNRKRQAHVDFLYDKILASGSRHETSGKLHVITIFNVIFGLEGQEDVYPIPVFKVRKCFGVDENDSEMHKYCVAFIDTEGRIYTNWADYIRHNTLPECSMLLPKRGYYQLDPNQTVTQTNSRVWLERIPSPACKVKAKVLTRLDMVSTVVSFAAMGVGVAAMLTPIGAGVAAAGTIGGAVSGLYTAGRSSQQLIDRSKHSQPINIADRNARGAWLGVAGGVAGAAAGGAPALLGRAVRTGANVGRMGRAAYNTVTIGNLVVNGVGVGNGVYNMLENYRDNQQFSYLEAAQLAAHILFFSNAVMNIQTAGQMIKNTQGQALQEYEASLRSNRHRRAFRRMHRNTRSAMGDATSGDAEVIRSVRAINNKDDFFAGVVRNQKIFNKVNAEVTFKDGSAMINHKVPIDPMEFWRLPVDARVDIASGPQRHFTRNHSAPRFNAAPVTQSYRESVSSAVTSFTTWLQTRLSSDEGLVDFVIRAGLTARDGSVIRRIIEEINDMENGQTYVERLWMVCNRLLVDRREFVTSRLSDLLEYLWKFVHKKATDHMQNYLKAREILRGIGSNIQNDLGTDPKKIFAHFAQKFIDEMLDSFEDKRQEIILGFRNSRDRTYRVCKVCKGHYFE